MKDGTVVLIWFVISGVGLYLALHDKPKNRISTNIDVPTELHTSDTPTIAQLREMCDERGYSFRIVAVYGMWIGKVCQSKNMDDCTSIGTPTAKCWRVGPSLTHESVASDLITKITSEEPDPLPDERVWETEKPK